MDYTKLIFETESDVEQKFVYELLTNEEPIGLNYKDEQIKTKPNIKKIKIDKGSSSKYYFPDYIVLIDSFPSLIVEVKNPDEDVEEGFREARLYANEINSSYPHKINPCKYIISTNGKRLLCGVWDSDSPIFNISQNNFYTSNESFSSFINEFSNSHLKPFIEKIKLDFRGGTRFWKPTFMLGGRTIRNKSVGENSFGVNLSLEYKYLFNPETDKERELVINNAYVQSKKRLAHVSPIDRLIRNIVTPSKDTSTEINDTSQPKEIIEQLKERKKLKNQVCLLIGSVGSGKSTFIDFLHKKALPNDLISHTYWLTLNLNDAPVNKGMIYKWVIEKSIENIKKSNLDIDLDSIDYLKKIFWVELKEKKGILSLLREGSKEYNVELYNILKSLIENKELYLKRLIQNLFTGRDKLLIFVLDNCDKRNRDEQLLMFGVANWLKTTFDVMVFLPIRETTYDIYRNEPPLDTVIKDLVFRIDPPLLIKVIQKRIEFALREIEKDQNDFVYFLPNNAKVSCKRSEVGNYLRSILHTLFQNDFFKKLLIGLTGRNIRKGLEIFLDFCKSGHLQEDIIFKMRTSSDTYKVPNHIISRVILRGNRVFYDENSSHLKNVFSSNPDDTIPDPFVRFSILNWLKERQRIPGPSKVKGYHKTSDLEKEMQSIGHTIEAIQREVEFLLFIGNIISESQDSKYNPDNLISITSSGIIHLDLLKNIDYLATVSEDTFFRNNEKAQIIADNITGRRLTPMSKNATLENADVLIKYLKEYKESYWFNPEIAIKSEDNKITELLRSCSELISRAKEGNEYFLSYKEIREQYPIDSIHEGLIVSIQSYGLIIQIGFITGLAHTSSFDNIQDIDLYEEGDYVDVKVVDINEDKKRLSLKIIE